MGGRAPPLYATRPSLGPGGGALTCCLCNKYQTPERADWRGLRRILRIVFSVYGGLRFYHSKNLRWRRASPGFAYLHSGQAFRRPPSLCEAVGPPGVLAAGPPSVAEEGPPAVATLNAPCARAWLGVV